jgi:hypothetical protein
MAGLRLSWLARNGLSPGEESLSRAIAAEAIEAEPSFGQINPSRRHASRFDGLEDETWQISSHPDKRRGASSEEKDTLACR